MFKVKVVDGKVWLYCAATQACRWKIELTGLAARIFQPTGPISS
jgi:hypothetical protein